MELDEDKSSVFFTPRRVRVGVLPIMVDPQYKLPYILLGRSRSVASWAEGSMVWSDFGGLVAQFESVEKAAARELVEESLGLLLKSEDCLLFAKSLMDENYICKVVAELDCETSILYLVRFQWRPALLHEFQGLHQQLKAMSHISRGVALLKEERDSVSRFKWLQSETDQSLKRVLRHPSLLKQEAYLPRSIVNKAHSQLSATLNVLNHQTADGPPTRSVVIKGVRSSWMEKNRLELFSLQQILCCASSVCFVAGQSAVLHARVVFGVSCLQKMDS